MALDAVRPIGLESAASGGTQTYSVQTEFDPRSDAADVAGVFLNGGTTAPDKAVLLDRSGGSMRFADQATTRLLSELITSVQGQPSAHQALADFVHFAPGPGDGWTSGAYQTTTFTGLLLTNRTWWTSPAQTTRIFVQTYAYTGVLLTTITQVVYAAGAISRTFVDTIGYTGLMPTSVSRTWS